MTGLVSKGRASLVVLPIMLWHANANAQQHESPSDGNERQLMRPVPSASAVAGSQSDSKLALPTIVDGRPGRDVSVTVRGLQVVGIDAASLADALQDAVQGEVLAQLRARTGSIRTDELSFLGIEANLNEASLVLEIALSSQSRSPQRVILPGGPRETGAQPVEAASFSVGVTGALQYLRTDGAVSRSSAALDLSGFANVGGAGGLYVLYGGLLGISGLERRFQRDAIVAFHDDQDNALRYSAGDIFPVLPRQLGDIQIAGFSLERNFQEIQPLRNVRPTGGRSFRVERPSRVEIYSNGALLRTLDVQPGLVDLRSIAAVGSSTNISIVVEDSFGRTEIDAFSLSSELELLAQDLDEFNISAGFLRDDALGPYSYDKDRPVAAGFYRRGISERLTLGAHFAGTGDVQSLGGDAALHAIGGLIVASATASRADTGTGGAAIFEYRGDPFGLADSNAQLNVQIEGRTRSYRNLASTLTDKIKLDGVAEIRFDLSDTLGVNAGASYFARYDEPGANKSLFAGLQASFGPLFATLTGRYAQRADGRDDSGVLLTVSLPIGRKHFASASADSASQRARLEFRKRRDFGIREFDYSGFVQTSRVGEDLGGRARFSNSRFEIEGVGTQQFGQASNSNAISLRAQAGVGFADGTFAVGRDPGRGFAIVKRVPSFKDILLDVYAQGSNRRVAQANDFGPAVVSQISPYRPDFLRTNILGDFPYVDIGTGTYETLPGAATGSVILVGSPASVTAIAQVVRPDGKVLAAKTGTLKKLETGETQTTFTTLEGRVFVQDLEPGKYLFSFEDGRYSAEVLVPLGAKGQIDFGTVALVER